jgi:hypothetical protein
MSDIRQARKAVLARILEGDGKASPAQRRAAFNNTGQVRLVKLSVLANPFRNSEERSFVPFLMAA